MARAWPVAFEMPGTAICHLSNARKRYGGPSPRTCTPALGLAGLGLRPFGPCLSTPPIFNPTRAKILATALAKDVVTRKVAYLKLGVGSDWSDDERGSKDRARLVVGVRGDVLSRNGGPR